MNTAASLGPLAYAVIEQYGDLARTAVALSVRRRQAAVPGEGELSCQVAGHLFSEDELALQYLQPGNWLTVGYVRDGSRMVAIEINLTTQAVRERTEVVELAIDGELAASEIRRAARAIPPLDESNSWDAA